MNQHISFCVYYLLNDGYAAQAGASIYSLFEHNTDLPKLDTWLFTDHVDPDHLSRILRIGERFGRTIRTVQTEEIDRYLKERYQLDYERCGIGKQRLLLDRLFVESWLAGRYEYALYLDSDTIVQGSILPAFSRAGDHPLCAAIDIVPKEYKKAVGLQTQEPYLNSGVLVINLEKWQERRCEEKMADQVRTGYHQYWYCDQDPLNIVLHHENAGILPLQYNLFPIMSSFDYGNICFLMGRHCRYYSKDEYEAAKREPVVIHFVYMVQGRPWQAGNRNPYKTLWEEYVQKAGWTEWPCEDMPHTPKHRFRAAALKIAGKKGLAFACRLIHLYDSVFIFRQYRRAHAGAWAVQKGSVPRG